MAVLITLLEQQWDIQPPTVVTPAITWWETELAHVKLWEMGPGVHQPVKVCYYTLCTVQVCLLKGDVTLFIYKYMRTHSKLRPLRL